MSGHSIGRQSFPFAPLQPHPSVRGARRQISPDAEIGEDLGMARAYEPRASSSLEAPTQPNPLGLTTGGFSRPRGDSNRTFDFGEPGALPPISPPQRSMSRMQSRNSNPYRGEAHLIPLITAQQHASHPPPAMLPTPPRTPPLGLPHTSRLSRAWRDERTQRWAIGFGGIALGAILVSIGIAAQRGLDGQARAAHATTSDAAIASASHAWAQATLTASLVGVYLCF